MDRIKGVEYFKRIYELGSFTAAADEFQCSNAVISKYVRFLESWTGSKLINRNTRTISFTDEGERFYSYCLSINEQTSEMLDSVADTGDLTGELVIACPVSLSMKVMAPLIFRFRQAYPQLTIRLQMSDQLTSLVGSGVDLAIRGIESPEDSSLIAVRLGTLERVLVASPTYLASSGTPSTIEDLRRHQCLIYSLSTDAKNWEFVPVGVTGKDDLPLSIAVSGPLVADNSLVLADAAVGGLGIALVPRVYIRQELADKKLQELELDALPARRSIYAVYSDRHYLPRRARLFIDFLRASLESG